MTDDDDELYDPPWEDDLYNLPADDVPEVDWECGGIVRPSRPVLEPPSAKAARMRRQAKIEAARLTRSDRPPSPRKSPTTMTVFFKLTPPVGKACGLRNAVGDQCNEIAELTLTVVCRSCGQIQAQVCIDCFDDVAATMPDGWIFCSSSQPGNHQIVHLNEANYVRASD